MYTTYRLNVDELTVDIVNSIKDAFKDKTIEITVSEAMDETEYLLATQANRQSLEKSMQQAKEGNVVVFTLDELQKEFGK